MEESIIVVGGGASGLMAALSASLKGKQVTVLEAGFKVGKKILASGNGRCNLTNKNLSSQFYNNYPAALTKFNNGQTLKLFNSLGLETYFDEEGRCYPVSNHSTAVLDVIVNKLKSLKCNIITNCTVLNIVKVNDVFNLETSLGVFSCDKVVIATGGNTMQNILKNFSVKVKNFVPSLCGFKTLEKTKPIMGIRQEAELNLSATNFNVYEKGEVIFREDGVSGICVFNLSSKLNWNSVKKADLTLNLLPNNSFKQTIQMLKNRKNNLSGLTAINFFDGLFINNMGQEILRRSNISPTIKVKSLTEKQLAEMATAISKFKLTVVGMLDNNQVHHGGIELDELTEQLELKKVKNMYCCGEVINVDAVCGGYNLQWAWSSGYVVGESLWLN